MRIWPLRGRSQRSTRRSPTPRPRTCSRGWVRAQLGAHYISYANVDREIRPDRRRRPALPGRLHLQRQQADVTHRRPHVHLARPRVAVGFPRTERPLAPPLQPLHPVRPGAGRLDRGAVRTRPRRHRAQCDAVHGTFMKKTVWMVHAWVVPGWASPKGVFSHEDPDLRCANGTIIANKVGFCPGT